MQTPINYKALLKEIIEEIRGEQIPDFDIKADLIDDLSVNSLEMIHIFLKLEDRFDTELNIEELELNDLRSVERLLGFVERSCQPK